MRNRDTSDLEATTLASRASLDECSQVLEVALGARRRPLASQSMGPPHHHDSAQRGTSKEETSFGLPLTNLKAEEEVPGEAPVAVKREESRETNSSKAMMRVLMAVPPQVSLSAASSAQRRHTRRTTTITTRILFTITIIITTIRQTAQHFITQVPSTCSGSPRMLHRRIKASPTIQRTTITIMSLLMAILDTTTTTTLRRLRLHLGSPLQRSRASWSSIPSRTSHVAISALSST